MKAIQIRMPNDIHDRVKELAAREGVSLNAFLVNSVSNEVVRKETRDFFAEALANLSRRDVSLVGGFVDQSEREGDVLFFL